MPSRRGNGLLGLLYLKLGPAVYNTQLDVFFTPLVNPGQHRTIPDGSMGHWITELQRQHKEDWDKYQKYDQTDKELRLLLIGEVHKVCISPLIEKCTWYAKMTTLTMIIHLYKCYKRIAKGGLQENNKPLKEEWDPNNPIEAILYQIKDAIDYTSTR